MVSPRRLRTRLTLLAATLAVSASLPGAPPAAAERPAAPASSSAVDGSRGFAGGEPGTGMPAPPSVPPTGGDLGPSRRAGSSIRWTDVGAGHWARTAIDYVAGTHGWMRDYPVDARGRSEFRPDRLESRKLFFRAAVEAFARKARVDRDIRFSDLPATAPFYRYANVAVRLGWVDAGGDRAINPDGDVTMATVHRVLVRALGLGPAADGLDRIRTADGRRFDTWNNFGSTVIGMRIGLRYNHDAESMDVNPDSSMPRAEVAWSLYRAKTAAAYTLDGMRAYEDITLPRMSREKRRMVQWGIRSAGYPYVWGGEWDERTGGGYCCGAQPVGGFDCSGLAWWLIKERVGTWDPSPPRPYRGWSLPQRVSRDMAAAGKRISWGRVEAGDLLFYDGSGDGVVDHVDVYVGNGWALDSSSSVGGVTLMWVGSGWYRDHFKHARRVIH
jgi:hypothetical protein